MSLGALAHNTQLQKLRHVENFYAYADELRRPGALDDAIGTMDMDALADFLEGFFITLRNRPNRTASDEVQWQTAYNFAKDTVTWLAKGATHPSFAQMEKRYLRLATLYQQLHVQRSKRADVLRALPARVVETLYHLLDPCSETNPFNREKTRWMVYVTFVLLLHQGLRRGELLIQLVDAIKSGFDTKKTIHRYWLNVNNLSDELDDPRANRPSIKTAPSIRQLPVSEFTANLIQTYTENYRGKTNHPFLLNSARDTPLSMEGLSALFRRVTAAMPKEVMKELHDRTGKNSITPHDLRHTCAVVRLNQLLSNDVPMDEALQRLRSFFGWARTSDMPRLYARAVFEDRMANIWSNVLDDKVEILRALPRSR